MVTKDIIIDNTLANVGTERVAGYLCHAYCHQGHCRFTFNNNVYQFASGDCLIVRRSEMVIDVVESDDFVVDVVYVTPEFIELSTPQSNYGMRGQVALFNNPIMHLTAEQQKVCALDFDYIKRRLALTTHLFHRDAMRNAIECMIIDFFDFHASLYGNEVTKQREQNQTRLGSAESRRNSTGSQKISSQYADLMERFLTMLERGDYRQNREIGYYANHLCVTSKYLSEVSKKVSGFPANYWITRYTTLDISRQLRDHHRTLTELSDLYHFSSPAYFSRYVQKYLGVKPTDLRE